MPERNPAKWKAIERLLDHNSRRDAAAAAELQAIVDKLVNDLGYSENRWGFLWYNCKTTWCMIKCFNRRPEIEHVVGLISVNNVNLNLEEGRGTGELF